MRGNGLRRWAWGSSLGVVALLGLLLLVPGAGASSAGQPLPTYGPTRNWDGTQIRSLDPAPPRQSAPAQAAANPASPPPDQVLSNELTFTRWAYVARLAKVYSTPTVWSHVLTRLHWYTEDGFPEIYLLLRSHWDTSGREWVLLRIPGRPNGRTGWVLRSAVGNFHLTHQLLVVNRARMRMYFYDNGRRIWSAPVGVGKASTPTPPGHFWIRERFVLTDPSNGYYPYAFGTADYSTLTDWPGGGVVGIHGPYGATWSQIPGRISHGCIRLHVPDDFWLGAHLHLGTPLWVK